MCLNGQYRSVDDTNDIVIAPKPIEDLIAAAKTKVSKPKVQYRYHHTVKCTTTGEGVCLVCKYWGMCVNGISEWDETVP
jgi:hypothetical protein